MTALFIERLAGAETTAALPALIDLLQDAVDSGASVGFLPPLDRDNARAYWEGVVNAIHLHTRILLVARTAAGIVGSVQLDLAQQPNARHRAEVMKLMVLRSARRQGIGRALLSAAEDAARDAGRSLLVLDTRRGDAAEHLYRGHGYSEAGVIPQFAQGADGLLHDTVFFYRIVDNG
jgi:ribosomal protein S18 acetylase RimI-like enzyme